MEPERWHEIERLYHLARERGAGEREAFLKEACAGDESLYEEVESLLACRPKAEKFIESPALELAARVLAKDRESEPGPDIVGRVLSHYTVREKIGEGGMGVIHRAYDEHLHRDVAVKILPPHTLGDEASRKRFRKEALALSRLSHPNVETVFDFDTQEGVDFLVMEYIPGTTLSEKLREGPLPEKEIVCLGAQLAEGLAAAHDQGIVHCDLKPANLRITPDGRLKILDFGIARLVQPVSKASQTLSITELNVVQGTVLYMAPEQLLGRPVDARTDIYGAGVVLYEIATGSRPFQSDLPVALVDQILHAPVFPPGRLKNDLSPGLEKIILKCLEKNPLYRYESARQLSADLAEVSSSPVRAEVGEHQQVRSFSWKPYAAVSVLVLLAALIWWAVTKQRAITPTIQTSVAVLPFQNLGSDNESDYLRWALPDEVATVLSYTPDLSIRPFADMRRYATASIEPQRAGRELHVATVVAGHFAREEAHIRVTVEVIDVASNRVLWRDTLTARGDDQINLQEQTATRIRQGLIRALGRSAVSTATATHPKSEEAYELYLRSIATPHDGSENKQGISMLERSIGLDSAYAPAWAEAGRRYYYDFQYSDGGMPARRRAQVATERALSLDPNLLGAARMMISLRAESGQLDDAYSVAKLLMQKRPASGEAHMGLSYVLRYAGRLVEAGRECDRALQLDPANYTFRSCSIPFEMLKQYDRAREFARLDAGSRFSSWRIASVLLSERRIEEAVPILTELQNDFAQAGLILAYLRHDGPDRIRSLSERCEGIVVNLVDPEQAYFDARIQSFCEQRPAALRQLRRAIEKNYCAYPALGTDPLLENVRNTPEFQEIHKAAASCYTKFAATHGFQ
ncbi:MAG: protein kinase [Acidobacteriia bacterium]|nr:protein kinase [Terriglobia bacterium]